MFLFILCPCLRLTQTMVARSVRTANEWRHNAVNILLSNGTKDQIMKHIKPIIPQQFKASESNAN